MDIGSTALLGAFIGIALGLVEVIKLLISYFVKRPNAEPRNGSSLTTAEREALFGTYKLIEKVTEILSAKDEDGLPLVYTPRSFIKLQSELVDTQQRIVFLMEVQTKLLEKLESKMDEKAKK